MTDLMILVSGVLVVALAIGLLALGIKAIEAFGRWRQR